MNLRYRILFKEIKAKKCEVKHTCSYMLIKSTTRSYSVNYFRFFLFLLFGLKLTQTCIIFKNNLSSGVEGNTICTTAGNLSIPRIKYLIYTTKLYETSKWQISHQSDWGCAGGSCPSIDQCNMLEYSLRKISNHYWIKDYCHSFQKGCFSGRGCIYGNYELIFYPRYNVYSISSISSNHITQLSIDDCAFSFSKLGGQVAGSSIVVQNKNRKDEWWMCSSSSLLGNPKLGMLGDLQIMENGKILYPWDSLKCGNHWYDSSCELPQSYLNNINQSCTKLPSMTNWGNIIVENGHLFLEETDQILIQSSCNKTELITNANCSNIELKLWGTRSHSSGLYITATAESTQRGLDTTVKNPCTGDLLILPCDGVLHYYKVPEDSYPCLNIDDRTITNEQHYYIEHYDKPHFTMFDSLTHMSKPAFGLFSLLSGTSVLWIVILIILLKH